MIGKLLDDIMGIGKQVAESLFPDEKDKIKRQEVENKITELLINSQSKMLEIEVKGSWLQSNWRPITMLVFVALVGAKWLGLTAPGVTEAIELELLEIIKVGLGGYVLGRSAEKAIKEWKK